MTRILLDEVLAQPTAVGTLRRALATGRVHHAYLFDGPEGVGKELAAFGLAQALVCERRPAGGDRACGECGACKRAVPRDETRRAVHPDVVVLERGLYDPAQIGRRTPETQDISIDQVRTLVLARAAFPPHEGRAKVFVIRRAEELNASAANALLKTLEEPGAGTHFVLLSAHADTLLPTVRSRTQRVRFAALPDDVVESLLEKLGVTERRREIARLAGGSMAAAMTLADPDESARRAAFAERAAKALEMGDLGMAMDLAAESKNGSREVLATHIRALASALVETARATCDDPASDAADLAAARYHLALQSIEELEGNASPQLVVESMLTRMRAP